MRVFLFLLVLIFLSCKESKSNNYSPQEEITSEFNSLNKIDVQALKENTKRIDSIKLWNKVDTISLENATEGGEGIYYKSNNVLEKISTYRYFETGKYESHIYIKDELLSQVFEKHWEYNRPIYWNEKVMKENNDNQVFDFDKSEIIEYNTYFFDNKLIKQENNQDGCPSSEEYLKSEEIRLLSEFNKLKSLRK